MRSLNGSHWPANMRSTRIVFQKANLTVKPANYKGRPQDARIVFRVADHPLIIRRSQSDEAVEVNVLGFIDDSHAPTTEFFDDSVVGDRFADKLTPLLPRHTMSC
jgi:hypothetical protein